MSPCFSQRPQDGSADAVGPAYLVRAATARGDAGLDHQRHVQGQHEDCTAWRVRKMIGFN